jgi:hypothetical protein
VIEQDTVHFAGGHGRRDIDDFRSNGRTATLTVCCEKFPVN